MTGPPVPGFIRDGWHCYANSALNVLFNLPNIMEKLPAGETNLKTLFGNYVKMSTKVLDPRLTIGDAGKEFTKKAFN